MAIEEIAPGIYSVDHRVVEGKNGVILGRRGALAIDGGTDPEEGEATARFIRERGYLPNRLALTHGHGDHVLGAGALAAGEVFAHGATPAVIRRQLAGWAERAGESVEESAARVVRPTVTFNGELRLELGDLTVRFFPTPGHSGRIRAEVGDRVRRGDAPEAIRDAVHYESYVGDRFPADRHGMRRRHQATVAKIVAEESA